MKSCHGCRWLDEIKAHPGHGYCAMVERSKNFIAGDRIRCGQERCELYEAGDFKTRFDGMEAPR